MLLLQRAPACAAGWAAVCALTIGGKAQLHGEVATVQVPLCWRLQAQSSVATAGFSIRWATLRCAVVSRCCAKFLLPYVQYCQASMCSIAVLAPFLGCNSEHVCGTSFVETILWQSVSCGNEQRVCECVCPGSQSEVVTMARIRWWSSFVHGV